VFSSSYLRYEIPLAIPFPELETSGMVGLAISIVAFVIVAWAALIVIGIVLNILIWPVSAISHARFKAKLRASGKTQKYLNHQAEEIARNSPHF